MGELLTKVITELVNEHAKSQEYGVSIVNIPDFDYYQFASSIICDRNIEIYFLGFASNSEEELRSKLLPTNKISVSFTVEEAEKSRNSGDESIFRILIIKRTELEKLSSLRWFPEITLESVYIKSCDHCKREIADINSVIEALIKALKSKSIRRILSFECVLAYLEGLIVAPKSEIPDLVKNNYYKLGLCADKYIDSKSPNSTELINRIKRNHLIVERISNLEQAERQSITNYYVQNTSNKEIPRLILNFYKTQNIELLKLMNLEDVEICLKAVKEKKNTGKGIKTKFHIIKPTALATQLVFDNDLKKINDIVEQLNKDVEERPNRGKREQLEVNINGEKMQFKVEPITEKIAGQLSSDEDYGGIIHAEVQSPDEAVRDIEKYEFVPFKKDYLDAIWADLKKIGLLVTGGEKISECLRTFLDAREKVVPYRNRLQDVPMLQTLSKYVEFADYLNAYGQLLNAINDDFPKIWELAPSNAKEIINTIISLDYIFVIGENSKHAIPTPLNPLYLWKYIELSKEMLSSKEIDNFEETHLSEDDKAFIIRKSEDIPDPLSVTLFPATLSSGNASFLPISGRVGLLPIYSNVPQINQSESGIEVLKQAIIRYLCLYPHAGMMFKICIIDPPSVEDVVSMLKMLNSDREFNINGIDISIYRTKEVSSNWIEIEDASLNSGMLGQFKGKRSLNFKLKIMSQRQSYSKILSELNQEMHMIIIFDPNEVKIEKAQNDKYVHIHPLCVPKIYKYNPIKEEVEIRPANEGGIFTTYSSIIEKLNENPSSFRHTSTYFNTPLKRETYDKFLNKTDWLVILDQSLKSWDISLRAASEKLFYKENDYRSVGIYSSNCRKFILGYDILIKQLGNYIPNENGIRNVIRSVREINDDGLISIASHSSNRIFDTNHGKGSLGVAIAAIHYKRENADALLVGLDTQLAQEWLSEREEGKLPDLIGLKLSDGEAIIDIIEVKTYSNNVNAFVINSNEISGNAVEQVSVLENLLYEIFGNSEKITTVSRKEILRAQVFENLFQSQYTPNEKRIYSDMLNALFAGKYKILVNKNIVFVDFYNYESKTAIYSGTGDYEGNKYNLATIGGNEIQSILSDSEYVNDFNANEGENYDSQQVDQNKVRVGGFTDNSKDIDKPAQKIEKGDKSIFEQQEINNAFTSRKKIEEKCTKLNKVFRDYGIMAYPINADLVQEAARFTRFKVELKSGETVKSLEKYKLDIGIQLEANGEILVDHIKGTKYISVDVPFSDTTKTINLIEHLNLLDDSNGQLDIVAGQTPDGKFEILDLSKAPHLLVAGTTGSGKTIFLYSIIVSLLKQYSIDELELLIIDPKQTDFVFFDDLPNLYGGHVVTDAEEALEKIKQINEVDKEERIQKIKACRSRDIISYNEKNPNNKMKRLVVIIDEYADLIQTADMQGNRKEFERVLSMLAQKVRSLGIHLIIATQRPSANIVTGVLKANIPYRVSFRLPSHTDSQTILDMSGAENLLGKGDMLMVTDSDTKRLQGLFISESELETYIQDYL